MLVYQSVDDRTRIELDEFPILFRIVIPFFFVIFIGNIQWDNVGNPSCHKPWLGMVGIPAIINGNDLGMVYETGVYKPWDI